MKKEELDKRLERITRVGNLSYGLGIIGLILSPFYIWSQSSKPDFTTSTLFIMIIVTLAIAYFFISIGLSITKTNKLLKTKLWVLTVLTLPFAVGIIPLILFIYGIIGIYNAYKLSDQDLSRRIKNDKNVKERTVGSTIPKTVDLPKDKLQALDDLSKLRKNKVITAQEFDKLKKEIIN